MIDQLDTPRYIGHRLRRKRRIAYPVRGKLDEAGQQAAHDRLLSCAVKYTLREISCPRNEIPLPRAAEDAREDRKKRGETDLSLMQAGCLYSYLVVQGGQFVVSLHQLAKQNAFLPHDSVVFLNLPHPHAGHDNRTLAETRTGKEEGPIVRGYGYRGTLAAIRLGVW